MDAAGAAAAAALLWSGDGEDEALEIAAGSVVKLQNFPVSWVEEKTLPLLSTKLARLLGRFGELRFRPVAQAEKSGELAFYAAFHEASAAKEAVAKLDGTDLRSNAEKKAAGGRAAHIWERFSVQLEDMLSSAVVALWSQQQDGSKRKLREKPKEKPREEPAQPETEEAFEFEFVDEDEAAEANKAEDSETEPPTEPPSEGEECDEDRSKVTVLLRNFPLSWLADEVLPQLGARISALLNKFGPLASKPKLLDGAMSTLGLVATVAFKEEKDAEKAIQALDGLDWRSPEEVNGGHPAAAHEHFRAEIVNPEEVAVRLAQLIAAPPGLPSFGGLPSEGAVAAQAFLSAEVDPNFQGEKPKKERPKIKLQQTGRNLRWERSSSDEEPQTTWDTWSAPAPPVAEVVEVAPEMRELDPSDTHLVIRGVPWDWSALQLQMLFTPFGGVQAMQPFASNDQGERIVRVRLEDLAQHSQAAAHFQQNPSDGVTLECEHFLGPKEQEILAQAAEAERKRKAEAEEAERQRQAVIAEAEQQRQAAMFAARRNMWEAANADFAAAVLIQVEKDFDRGKRLQAAAESLRDTTLSKQRRRMMMALVEAERKRQAPMIPGMERAAMAAADADSDAWQKYVVHAERQYLKLIKEAEEMETRAMAKAERETRKAEQARIDMERRRLHREYKMRETERASMKKADQESRVVEAAIALSEERQREEFEAELMERAEDEVHEFLQEEKRREADERRRMAADEAEFFRRQEEEKKRRAEEERKQKLVREWRRKQQARRALDSDEEQLEPEEDEEDKAPKEEVQTKQKDKEEEQPPPKAGARNPFGPVTPRQAPEKTNSKEDKDKENDLARESKRARKEEKRRLKEEEAAKRRKREKEEAEAELQRFEQELQRRNNFLLRRRQQEEDDQRKEVEAQLQAAREEEERKQRKVEIARMVREDKLRMKFEVEERKQEAEKRKREEAERRKQDRAERRRKEEEQEKHEREEQLKASARCMRPEETARLLQAKEQEIARIQAELAKKRKEEAIKRQQEERMKGGRSRSKSSSPATSASRCQEKSSSSPSAARKRRRVSKRRKGRSPSRSRRNEKRRKHRNRSRSSSSSGRRRKHLCRLLC
ncbi:unnamed protein product [Durusdinium trenchii]|uniref:RRM domain-containing protein n=2 Tax=Durusdinium trenchii TaxID=1381693 RepID=A0ABP0SUX6_9DINO